METDIDNRVVAGLGVLAITFSLLSIGYVYEVQGVPGTPGENGLPGENGSRWYSGVGFPSNGLGNDGDYYLESVSDNVYLKALGAWFYDNICLKGLSGTNGNPGTPGENGLPGENGSRWYSGNGVPSDNLGNDNDYYLENVSDNVYLKSSGHWNYDNICLKGAQGIQGNPGENGITENVEIIPNYIIYKDNADNLIKAKDGHTGLVVESNSDFSTVMQWAINAMIIPSGGGNGEIIIKQGLYDVYSTISLANRMTLKGIGRGTYLINRVVGGSAFQISGALYDDIISDLTIEGVANCGNLIYAENATNVWLQFLFLTLSGTGSGIYFKTCGWSQIQNCSIESNALQGIYLQSCNTCRVMQCGIKSNTQHGVYFDGSYSGLIEGNMIQNNGRCGIYVNGATAIHNIISGNNVFNNSTASSGGYDGIRLYATTRNSVVSNTCFDSNATKKQNYGITENSTSDNNLIVGNICLATEEKAGGISVVGAHTINANNLT